MHPYSGGSTLAAVRVQGRRACVCVCAHRPAAPSFSHKKMHSPQFHAQVLRVSAFSVGLVYGSWHLSSLKSRAAKAAAKAEAGTAGHH